MDPIKVLIVDDSVVIRRFLTVALDAPIDIEVVGFSTNGRLALDKIQQLKPDVVSLDVMMPEMNGIECAAEIRKRFCDLPIIMFSSLTEEGASTTLSALEAGANDFVAKPSNAGGFAESIAQVSHELLAKIRALGNGYKVRQSRGMSPAATREPKPALPKAQPVEPIAKRGKTAPIEAIVIGSSTGGPNALNTVFSQLAKDLPVPIFITQHMPPKFTRLLSERLAARSGYDVREAKDGEVVKAGVVRIAPGDFHLEFERRGTSIVTVLNQKPPVHSCRPAVDLMFASACRIWGGSLLSIVLTGMGRDGGTGAALIARAGGRVIAQDEATSVVWGMPGAVVEEGAADKVLPLDAISPEIDRLMASSQFAGSRGGAQ